MKLHDRKISHREVGAKSESKSSTKKVTEKLQATTGQYAAYQYFTNYLPLYSTRDSLFPCTAYNLPTKEGFGPIIDVMII